VLGGCEPSIYYRVRSLLEGPKSPPKGSRDPLEGSGDLQKV